MSLWRNLSAFSSTGVMFGGGSFGLFSNPTTVVRTVSAITWSTCLRPSSVVVVVVVVVVDYTGNIQINIFATPLPPAGSMTGCITVDHNRPMQPPKYQTVSRTVMSSLSISFIKEFLHLTLSLYCFVSIIFNQKQVYLQST